MSQTIRLLMMLSIIGPGCVLEQQVPPHTHNLRASAGSTYHHEQAKDKPLLYIGKVGAGTQAETFGNQLHENYHFIKEYCTTGGRIGEISIRIGRIHCEEYAGERYWKWPGEDWISLVNDARALLINHHFDRLQNKQRPKCKQALSIQNTDDYDSLDERVKT